MSPFTAREENGLSLRDAEFLDRGDKWSQIDSDVREAVRSAWDTIHANNPVSGEDGDNQ